jgi:hypothetical protein
LLRFLRGILPEVAGPLLALLRALLFLLGLLVLVCLATGFPWPLALLDSGQKLLVVLGPAQLTEVLLRQILCVLAHAHADIMLPCPACVACDPRLARVLVLFCCAADAADDFFLGLLWLGRRLLVLLSAAALRGLDGLVELLQGLVLAFRGSNGSAWFGIWRSISG